MIQLPSPAHYKRRFPVSEKAMEVMRASRNGIQDILDGRDERLIVIVGPCSIHDPQGSGLEYATRLADLLPRLSNRFLVVMRTFLEKPRTTIGWEGIVSDPWLTGDFDIAAGIAQARKFLLSVLELGVPTATEFTNPMSMYFLEDLLCWAAVGARSTEAAVYRNMASGLTIPVGFKNGTGGSVQIAVDGIVAASHPHALFGISEEEGRVSQIHTKGNRSCHLVLRGSLTNGPNYEEKAVAAVLELLKKAGCSPRLMIDCSHGNSEKDPQRQIGVCRNVVAQRLAGNKGIIGFMVESNLFPGNQKLGNDPTLLQYGVSITDACIGWEETAALLREAHDLL
ncbi:MAG: 3-deoxy-7-phosphoheptulonate synthase [Candidatus Colwellbacteria bacterium]|nr:3-deoxy-7-phosphoheptulonate synthase [Candidatus Colwellbacteria bacterium]